METKLLKAVLTGCLILFYVRKSLSVQYLETSRGHTSFPHGVFGSDATKISVASNLIVTIDYVESFPTLTEFHASSNLLVSFPDLQNVSSTLTILYLFSNQIAVIDPPSLLDQLVVLEKLYLQDNPLVAIPDVPGPSNTLYILSLSNTSLPEFPTLDNLGKTVKNLIISGPFKSVSVDDLNSLPSLSYISLKDMQLSLGNLCRVSTAHLPTMELKLAFSNNAFQCTEELVWARLASLTANITWHATSYPQCTLSSGATAHLNTVGMNELLERGSTAYFQRIENLESFYCYPQIMSVVADVTNKVACVSLCLKAPDCVMAAYEDNKYCVLASPTPGDEIAFRSYSKWYMFSKRL